MKTAIIYTRVSSKDQVDGFSLESQEKVCREFADKNKLQVLKVFREEGESAKTADRTQLQAMIRYCQKNRGKIGKLLIYKVDRLSRKNEDYFTLKIIFRNYGLAIQSATEQIEDDPSGKFMEGILASMAEFDNSTRAQRTAEGMRARLLNGLWSWTAPVGYKNSRTVSGDRVMILDPEKAPLIKRIFEEYSTGLFTFQGVARKVSKMNLRSKRGKKISNQLVMKILRNPLYCGRIECPNWGVSVQGQHKAIVPVELFKTAQRLMNGETPWKKQKSRANPDFPLRGIRCESCGGNISGGWTKGRNKKYAYYSCITEDCSKRQSIPREDFENDFSVFLENLTPNSEDVDAVRESVKLAYQTEMESVLRDNKKVDTEIERVKFQKEKLLELKLKELIDDIEFKEQNEKFGEQIQNLELSRQEQIDSGLDFENAINSAFELIKSLPRKWRDLEVEDLRVLRGILFPENLTYSYPGIKTAEIPIIYKLNSSSNQEKNLLVAPTGFEPVLLG